MVFPRESISGLAKCSWLWIGARRVHDWGLASTLPVSFSPYKAKFSRAKHFSLLIVIVRFELKYFTPGACTIKLITALIYGFRNKLECLPLSGSTLL